MQKRLFVLVLVMALLNLSGCTVKEISKEQADNDFSRYQKEIINLSQNAGFRIEEKKKMQYMDMSIVKS